ncbi:hypothetical protein GCM10010399_30890 [Dactylosporangium fulvum]|uniref:FxsB family radical SAM/SPASM domain protein n=1 Tax=Dactylosporangium fulvum TaxID=53359 RepID=A0ABY5W5P0_9ACTN|nr:FxsB family cyclophane-forming radical SAM/SPASM peptide maturase [Dactylosporangium fulvum]UWP85358.1 FxsB family radical SAM/SPASM domain protein [Dactylosporangium fulvum]
MQELAAPSPRRSEWPTAKVVADALADPDWRPLPFAEFIVKVHGRCNLSCDYCYMYEMADQSWRTKPVAMTPLTIDRTAWRIREHLEAHPGIPVVEVILHGGEPLLVGAAALDRAANAFVAAGTDQTAVTLAIQTNGVLLDDDILAVLAAHQIRVGISVDGGREAHDRHRRYANGNGSHDAVMRGIDTLRRTGYAQLFSGLLCTVDLANDPIDVYESLLASAPPVVNFLLPHGTWATPPPGWAGADGGTPYADWLIPIFDRWYHSAPPPTRISLFEEIIALLLGGASRTEALGLAPVQAIVVETDGSLELVDSLKVTFDGAPATGLDVFRHSFDAAMLHPAVVARQRGLAALSPTCLACPVRDICGGGHYPHRYRPGSGFLNPSVYCADLFRLIEHINGRVVADLAARRERLNGTGR